MFSSDSKKPLSLDQSIVETTASNQIQQLKSVGNQPRTGVLSPNVISNTNAPSVSTPSHVSNVRVQVKKVSDVTSKVTVSFTRNPNDFFFSQALVHVSGYKGNPAPTQVASGQSPISFALENTGEPVSVKVQSTGSLGPAPLSTAPNATLQLRSTNLATTTTASGTGITSAALGVIQSSLTTDNIPRPTTARFVLWSASLASAAFLATNDIINLSDSGGVYTTVAPTATSNTQLKITTNAGNSGSYGCFLGNASISFGRPCMYVARLGGFGASTGYRLWAGLADAAIVGGGGDNPTAVRFLAFRYNSLDSANWMCATGNGTTTVYLDSGVPPTIGSCQVLKIVYNGSSSALFYINGVLVGTMTATLPATSVNAGALLMQGGNGIGGTNGGIFEYAYAESTSP